MPVLLRVELIILSLVFLFLVLKTIRDKKLLVQYALVWIILAAVMLLFAVIPGFAEFLTTLVGIETTSNFIYLAAIVALLILCFSLTVIVSKQTVKIKSIIQSVSIEDALQKEQEEK